MYEDVKKYIESNNQAILIDKEYKNKKTKLKCRCLKCNGIFERTFERFEVNKYHYCESCSKSLSSDKLRYDIKCLKKETIQISNCILLSDEYINNIQNLKFQCGCGNIFETSWYLFKKGKQCCNECNNIKRWNYDEVLKFIEENSNCKLLTKGYKGVHENLEFKCECGERFQTTFRNFRDRYVRSCRKCRNIKSKLEIFVEKILKKHKIDFIEQYSFEDCVSKNNKKLPFDFYLPNNNLIIEVDGEQHFTERAFNKDILEFADRLINDAIKNSFCEDNNINILRIPYFDIENSEDLILSKIC